jgi:hypothetical protein
MAQPLGRGLRPARRSGLTSPDPVRTPTPQGHPDPTPTQEPRTSRTTGKRRDAHAPTHLAELLVQESSRKRATAIHRWIEAERALVEHSADRRERGRAKIGMLVAPGSRRLGASGLCRLGGHYELS